MNRLFQALAILAIIFGVIAGPSLYGLLAVGGGFYGFMRLR